jgi:hypothetical protein
MDLWSWPNGVIPNSIAALVTGLTLLISWYRTRHKLRWWLGPQVRASAEVFFPVRGRWLRQLLKAVTLAFVATFLAFLLFTVALIAMVPFYMLEMFLNPKH